MDAKPANALTRRGLIAGVSAAPLAMSGCATGTATSSSAATSIDLPALADFPDMNVTYLDSGSVHPFSAGGRQAIIDFLSSRAMTGQPPGYSLNPHEGAVVHKFTGLINATAAEVTFVQSTSMGEWLTVRALGIPESGGRIVTDALHFFGSFHLYNELEKQGMEVVIIPIRDNQIRMLDLEAAVNANTKLVSISAVSTVNGFQHDLKAVADLAHAHGAHVYVDAVHALGAVPFDVRATNIDFMASSSYKWLMGDMGLGFIYTRADLIPRLRRPQMGYEQVERFVSHAYPFDPPGPRLFETAPADDARGLYAMGTYSNTVIAQLDYSLGFIERVGVANIQAYRQPLIETLRRETPRLRKGFVPMTPEHSTSALITFAYPNAREVLSQRLRDQNLRITVSANRIRFSPSVFNTMADIERALEVLSSVPAA